MPKEFTDRELQQIAMFVARRYLEVERGLRDKRTLRPYLSPRAYSQQFVDGVSRFFAGGTVRQDDLGSMRFQRSAPRRAHVTIPARETADRWGALVMELRADLNGRWRVTELTRAQDRNLVHASYLRLPVASEQSPRSNAFETQMVRAAHQASVERHAAALEELAVLAPEKPARELKPGDVVDIGTPDKPIVTTLRGVSFHEDNSTVTVVADDGVVLETDADRPIVALRVNRDEDVTHVRARVQRLREKVRGTAEDIARWSRHLRREDPSRGTDDPDRGAASEAVGDYVTRILGEQPSEPRLADVWQQGVRIIEHYRGRWGVTESHSPLGYAEPGTRQADHREATLAQLRSISDLLFDEPGLPAGRAGRGRTDVVAATIE